MLVVVETLCAGQLGRCGKSQWAVRRRGDWMERGRSGFEVGATLSEWGRLVLSRISFYHSGSAVVLYAAMVVELLYERGAK